MNPSPYDWAIGARVLPGGRWHGYADTILINAGVHSDAERDEILAESAIRIARAWRRFDPSRGLAEWTFARHFVRAEASKRKPTKGAIVGPRVNNQHKLFPKSRAAWESISAVPLDAPLPSTKERVSEIVTAPTAPSEARVGAALRQILDTIAEQSDPDDALKVRTVRAALDATVTEIAEAEGTYRQKIDNRCLRGVRYIAAHLTRQERMTLSMLRSTE